MQLARPSLRRSRCLQCHAIKCYSTKPLPQDGRRFRMAVIGSGPAGFYTSYRVMSKIENAMVDMYEHLPVPFGLVRFGVAPDHPDVKNCQDKFAEVAASPNFNFIGNITIGDGPAEIPLQSLVPHYDAILFAYGASKDKALGIPGEDTLKGIYSARAFVGWYNGLPGYADLAPDLKGEDAVIIGQGNVALDVARILLQDPDALKSSDITSNAMEALCNSKVNRVRIIGRRGPLQAAFTIKEVRELINLPTATFHHIDDRLLPSHIEETPRGKRRLLELLKKGSSIPKPSASKSWSLDFCLSPISFNPASGLRDCLGSLFAERTSIDPADPTASATRTGEMIDIKSSLAFRSIGYKSEALPGFKALGVPFNDRRGIIPNVEGRIVKALEEATTLMEGTDPLPGLYCTGWVQRGPTGVIATTMQEAFHSADSITQDWALRKPFLHGQKGSSGLGWEGLVTDALQNGCRPVHWHDWQRIDAVERERGKRLGKVREKLTRINDMMEVLD